MKIFWIHSTNHRRYLLYRIFANGIFRLNGIEKLDNKEFQTTIILLKTKKISNKIKEKPLLST